MRNAIALLEAGEYEKAYDLLARGTSDPRLLCHRARALAELGRDGEAIATMEEALACSAGLPFVQATLALLLLDMDRPAEAAEPLERALALDPRNVYLPAYRGLVRFETGARDEGLQLLETQLIPASPAQASRVALALERWLGPGEVSFVPFVMEVSDGDPEPAVFAALNRYLLWPDAAASWLHVRLLGGAPVADRDALGSADEMMRRGETAKAVETLRARYSEDRTHGDPTIRLALAETLLVANDASAALELLPETTPSPVTLLPCALRAAALFRTGRAADAAAMLDACAPLASREDFSILYLHGLAHLSAGERRRARQALEAAFRLEAPDIARALIEASRSRIAS